MKRDSLARKRSLAVLLGSVLGLALSLAGIGAAAYWRESFVHGEEVCIRCGMERDVKGRGPIRWRSEPRGAPPSFLPPCAGHVWHPIGCWEKGGGFARLVTPIVLAWTAGRVLHEEYDVPIRDLRLFVERAPSQGVALRTEARSWLAYALNASGDPEGALAELEVAVEEDSRDPWLSYAQGRAWTTIGELERAIDAYRRATDLDPGFGRAWQWLGHSLLLADRAEEARTAATHALELAEDADDVRLAYWRTDRRTMILEILEERALACEALGDDVCAAGDRARAAELRGAE